MACGSCGGRKAAAEYEVTFKDGSTKVVATLMDARIVIAQDTTSDPEGRRRAASYRVVPKRK